MAERALQSLRPTIRAMSDGSLDSQVGARICNGLGTMRACFETQKLEQLEERMEKIIDHVPYKRITSADEDERWIGTDETPYVRTSTDEAERYTN
jgi:hypothetical protein